MSLLSHLKSLVNKKEVADSPVQTDNHRDNKELLPYIQIGRNEVVSNDIPLELIDTYRIQEMHYINVWSALSNEDIVPFFKGLVICERLYRNGLGHGSASPAIKVYHEIQNRGLDVDYKIGDWAFQYSENEYIPLGFGNRHGAKTIYEYLEWERKYEESLRLEKENSIKQKAEQKQIKAERHAQRLKDKELRDIRLGYKKLQ